MCCRFAPYFTSCCSSRQLLGMKGIKVARAVLGSGFHAKQSPSEGGAHCGMKSIGQAELDMLRRRAGGSWCERKANLLLKTTIQHTMQYYKSFSLLMSSSSPSFAFPGPCHNLPLSLWEPWGDSSDWELLLYGTIMISELRIPLGFPICLCEHIPI